MPTVALKNVERFPFEELDRCVACGLCLPHCPTYLKSRQEAASPRGRIALMRALVHGELPLSDRLESHLDLCLVCRACEAACPVNVGYGRLIDSARAVIEANRDRRPRQRAVRRLGLDRLTATPDKLRRLGGLLHLYQRSGLQRLVRLSGLLELTGAAALEAQLPDIAASSRWQDFYPAHGTSRGEVALFTGCVAAVVDRATLEASIRTLNLLGYGVRLPRRQVCCGALYQHNGEPAKALALIRENLACFNLDGLDAIVYTASGCGAMLAEYARQPDADPDARAFVDKLRDINQFLAATAWPDGLHLTPLDKTVAVHDPCTLTNVLRLSDEPYRVLERIPQLRVVTLPENHICCGAAGTYHLAHPEMAGRLRADKLDHLRRIAPDSLVTTNIGCALYLAQGIKEAGLDIEVVHPIVLLARQLRVIRREPAIEAAS